jgi:hypothetical protein
LPGGKTIPWNQLKSFMNHPNIRQFQLIQNADASLTVEFVAEKFSDVTQTKKLLTGRFHGLLGDSIRIEYSVVEKIAPAQSGKSVLVVTHYDPAIA